MTSKAMQTVMNIKVIEGADKYPDRIIFELATHAAMLQHIRKVYLASTSGNSGDYIPFLMLEAISDDEARIDDDAFQMEIVMNELFNNRRFDLRVMPPGPWWAQVKPVAQIIRDLNS